MLIAFFVNAMQDEYLNYTTTVLAHEASRRAHEVCYITPGDFVLGADDVMRVHARFVPAPKSRSRSLRKFFKDAQEAGSHSRLVEIGSIDVLMLRSDPAQDAGDRPWAQDVGIQFGRRAARLGVLVVNDPDALSQAMNKLYFQSFPPAVRAETLITRHASDIKEFARKHKDRVVLKPLQGSGGQGVFLLNAKSIKNLNQVIDTLSRDGYIIAQAYVAEAEKGDIRLFLMNGVPLQVNGKYAAMRRVSAKDDVRSNIHAGGRALSARIGPRQLHAAELIRPKLVEDGMFLVGIDIIGDTILEVNVFSPGNLLACSQLAGANFASAILQSLERKVEIAREFPGHFSNRSLAVM
jgi:glutathione synthase